MTDPTFADAIPERLHQSVDGADGRVSVLVPKFTGRLLRRFLVPRLAQPDIRMQLDEVGSFVWRACDGRATVGRLGAAVAQRFAITPADAEQRVQLFLRRLVHEGSIAFTVKEHH